MIMDTLLEKEHSAKFKQIKIQNKEEMLKVKHDLIYSEIFEILDIRPTADINHNYNITLDEINQANKKYVTKHFRN